jgi:hypothetical protein
MGPGKLKLMFNVPGCDTNPVLTETLEFFLGLYDLYSIIEGVPREGRVRYETRESLSWVACVCGIYTSVLF